MNGSRMNVSRRMGPDAGPRADRRLWCLISAGLTLCAGLTGPGSARAQEPPLTLTDVLELALEAHPAVGRARAAEEAAVAQVKQSQSTRLPSLSGQASLARYQEPMVVAPLHGFDPMHPPAFDRNLLQGAVNLGYTVFDGGARGARISRAEAGAGAARAGGEMARMDVMVQTSAAFLGVLTAGEVLDAVRAQKTALMAEVDRVRQFLEEGKAARVDLLRVEAALSRVEASEISARSDLELAQGRLARFTGRPVEEIRARALSRVTPRGDEVPGRVAVLTDARSVNPELARARDLLDGATAAVRVARAAWFPKLEAGGRYADFGTLDGGHVQEWQGTLQVSYPIFVGGARKGEEERARAEERQAAETLRLTELNLEDEAESALSAVEEALALREALEVSVTQNEEVARIEALALEAGAGVQTDFLKAEADLFQARASLAQARHGEVLARIRLARVQGALTPGWIQENMEVVP